MKFVTIAAMFLAPITLAVSAAPTLADEYNTNGRPSCLHLSSETTNNEDPSTAASLRKGQLYVKLNSAKNLSNKDWFGKSDPFVEMWLEKDYKQRSKDAKGQNPVYNQTFCFYVRAGQDKLYAKVVDKDTLNNDKIGDTSIPLSGVFVNGKEGPKNYDLTKWLGLSTNGQLNMDMQYTEDYGNNNN
ncbi:hypothetical protein BGX24_002008 [Mortierella sp. AD032]|nr:hypothetical protein BGX24_002008 [Mortierella sp. AD032]